MKFIKLHCVNSITYIQCLIIKNSVLKELDPAESIKADWTVTSMSDEVLKHVADFPEELKTVREEDVRLPDKCL